MMLARSPASSAWATRAPSEETKPPFASRTEAASTPRWSAARSRSVSRSNAAAWETGSKQLCMLRLPAVTVTGGIWCVSGETTSIAANSTFSSSATTCARPVRIPCPISLFGLKKRIRPSGRSWSQLGASSASGAPKVGRVGREQAERIVVPPANQPVRIRNSRREKLGPASATASLLGGAANGAPDSGVGAAPAEVSRQGAPDLRIPRVGAASQQGGCAHDLAWLAVAALRHGQCDPGLLHGVEASVARRAGQTLDGGDAPSERRARRDLAGADCSAVQVDRAGPAESPAAPVFGPPKSQVVAQNVEETHFVELFRQPHPLPVDLDSLGSHCALSALIFRPESYPDSPCRPSASTSRALEPLQSRSDIEPLSSMDKSEGVDP